MDKAEERARDLPNLSCLIPQRPYPIPRELVVEWKKISMK